MAEKTIGEEIKDYQKSKSKQALTAKTEAVRYAFKGLGLLVEAAAMAVTSGFTIYSGWHQNLPRWGAAALLTAGAFIAIRAFIEFVKFLNRRG